MKIVKCGYDRYYEIHEDAETPQEIKDKLLKKEIEQSFYSKPYRHYKIIKKIV